MDEFEPKQFGKYYLVEKLAVGGMAEIYKAKTFGAEGFEKLLAIKRILPHCAADKEFITMLIDEAKLSVLLSHANIVQVYDLGKVGDDYFIAMEFIHGVNLRDVMYRCREAKAPMPPDIAVYIVSEICKGLDYAHRKTDTNNIPLGIVHRDVSPQNVLISHEGEVKIVDFGIAKAAMNISHTMAGILKGKIAYMSPEQALGKPIDRRTDIFSTGILLYEMLTGSKLYTGESQFEVLKKIRTVRIDSGSLPEGVPHQLRPIIARALAYKIEDRYQNAGDFQVDLTKFLYAMYLDFSPRKLSTFINEMFHAEISVEGQRGARQAVFEQQTMSMSMNEGAKQVEIVHGHTPPPAGHITDPGMRVAPTRTAGSQVQEITTDRKLSKTGGGRWFKRMVAMSLLAFGAYAAYHYVPAVRFWEKQQAPEEAQQKSPIPLPPPVAKPEEPKPVQITGALNIISDPPGAAIMLDGRLTGLTTPATLEKLPIGTDLHITLSKPNFEDFEQVMSLTSDKPQKLSTVLKSIEIPKPPPPPPPVEEKPTPEPVPPRAALAINTDPRGATILVEGKSRGMTPATLEDLEIGKTYSIRLQKEGYKSVVRKKTINKEKEQLIATLEPEITQPPPPAPSREPPPSPPPPTEAAPGGMGKIRIASNPSDADVFINSEHRGKTPLTLNVPSGQVSVLVSKEGLSHYSTKVSVRPGETVNLSNVSLGDLYGEVSIVTTPPRATVVFDGQQIPARTPVTVRRVRTDQGHSISVTLDGFKAWSKSFNMEGSSKSFNIVLERQ